MLPNPQTRTVVTHWGVYHHGRGDGDRLSASRADPDPSPIGFDMLRARRSPARILRPAVRASYHEGGPRAPRRRGGERFVEVSWDVALDLVAAELRRVREEHGNAAIYGGSYGWGSAGRFHHAQSQIHRFLNSIGGFTRSVQNYSYAAGDVILPYVIGTTKGLSGYHTTWDEIIGHTRMLVSFGGLPHKNSQINNGGISGHRLRQRIERSRERGIETVLVSPIRDDALPEQNAEWMALRPNTDVALMLGLAHTILTEGLHDRDFLTSHTVGLEQFSAYVLGASDGQPKSADWAAAITEIPTGDIRLLARRMAATRTMIMVAWSLQRSHHGEQAYWMAIVLAALLGQIGLPGGGFGFGYGSVEAIGEPEPSFTWPRLPQLQNPVTDYIPVARIADMLLSPGEPYDYDGKRRHFPDVRLVYWAGGNPFHHHQDLNRLVEAWNRPDTVVVHEMWWNATARHADIVLPCTTPIERNDIGCSARDGLLAPSHKVVEPLAGARNDYDVFSGLARRLGTEERFTEGRDEEAWLRHMYDDLGRRLVARHIEIPDFDTFWRGGPLVLPTSTEVPNLLQEFRDSPAGHPLKTPSGRIELHSERIAGYGYDDCPPTPGWLEPYEWLGSGKAGRYPLHLISNQPRTKLHSQYDNAEVAAGSKIKGREPIRMNPDDARRRGLVDGAVVRVFNDRGQCLAGLVISDALREGVVQLSTGAWYDPAEPGVAGSLDKHGNPNVLTRDVGTS
ncbi:MAG: molybdopterin-dependent oxidoreductase, partial [Hyphomicrobiales bacterium]